MPSTALSARLQAIWYRSTPPPLPLQWLARVFAAGVGLRRGLYRRGWLRPQALARPVIVVGNLTVGGSGKTPLVAWICAQLRASGRSPGIVLRGYGGSAAAAGSALRVDATSDPGLVGDEAVLLRQRTGVPVAVGRERVRAAQLAIDAGADVIVADDGLQHLALPRCCEIVVVDGARGFGNGWLLPAGPLREGLERLERVDAILIHGAPGPALERLPAALRARCLQMELSGERLEPLHPGPESRALASFAGERVHAIAGIGHPARFFARLRAAGLEPIEHPFPDHHRFQAAELQFDDALPVLMTEKDAVKCRQFDGARHWYLPVAAHLDEADARALGNVLAGRLAVAGDAASRET